MKRYFGTMVTHNPTGAKKYIEARERFKVKKRELAQAKKEMLDAHANWLGEVDEPLLDPVSGHFMAKKDEASSHDGD